MIARPRRRRRRKRTVERSIAGHGRNHLDSGRSDTQGSIATISEANAKNGDRVDLDAACFRGTLVYEAYHSDRSSRTRVFFFFCSVRPMGRNFRGRVTRDIRRKARKSVSRRELRAAARGRVQAHVADPTRTSSRERAHEKGSRRRVERTGKRSSTQGHAHGTSTR